MRKKLFAIILSAAIVLNGGTCLSFVSADDKGSEPASTIANTVKASSSTGFSNEEMLAGYVNREYGAELYNTDADRGNSMGEKRLTGYSLDTYRQLKPEFAKIADGKRANTSIKISTSAMKLTYTYKSLGYSGKPSFFDKLDGALLKDIDLDGIFQCILVDFPYDLYWFDKTVGMRMSYSYEYDAKQVTITDFTLHFTPSVIYKSTKPYTVNLNKTSKPKKSAEYARKIVKDAENLSDYAKLLYYKDQICDLTSYNYSAVYFDDKYGGPWQLIYVFDRDAATNVVCEGYAKAFQYLADETTFNSEKTASHIVEGSTGEDHMWNVVSMEDGKNYIVDVTNIDENPSEWNALFLGGAKGTVSTKYVVDLKGEDTISYKYDSDTKKLYGNSMLTISDKPYETAEIANCTHDHASKVDVKDPACTDKGNEGDIRCNQCGKVLEKGKKTEAIGHDFVTDKEKPATNTSSGLTKGTHCKNCEKITVVQKTVPRISKVTLYKGVNKSYKLTSSAPAVWKITSGSKYATLKGSTLTCKSTGTVKVKDSKSGYTVTFTIKKPEVKVSKKSISLKKGSKTSLTAKAAPTATIKWSTSNKKVATVNGAGTVTGIKKGTCYIYASANGVKAKVKVTVR